MRLFLHDGRQMTGQMLSFDKVCLSVNYFCRHCLLPANLGLQHMNIVLADAEEFRRVRRKQNKSGAPGTDAQVLQIEDKRSLGLIIIRGAQVLTVAAESPPPADPSARLGRSTAGGISSTLGAGPGVARPAGRGAPPATLAVSPSLTPPVPTSSVSSEADN